MRSIKSSSIRWRWLALIGAAALAVPAVAPVAAHAEGGDGGEGDKPVASLTVSNLPDFLKNVISGSLRFKDERNDPAFLAAFRAPNAQYGGGALVPFRDPAPSFSRNILLSRDFGTAPVQTEPSLGVDPKDSKHIVVAVTDFNFPSISMYTSFDSGETWEGPTHVPFLREDDTSGGDPVVAFTKDGKPYLIHISIGNEDFDVGNFELNTDISSIAVSWSDDGGRTWTEPISTSRSTVRTDLKADKDGRARGEVFISFLDKPWLRIGPRKDDPSREAFYLTYTDFNVVARVVYVDELPALAIEEVQSTIRLVKSDDGGRTWTRPIDVSPRVRRVSGGRPRPGVGDGGGVGLKRVVQGGSALVAPDGTVYVSWADSTDDGSQKGVAELYISRSDDGGKTFSTPERAQVVREPGFRPRNADFRYWATLFPQTVAGPNGELYMVYGALNPDKPTDDGDIFFTRSTDKGRSWSRPIVLGGDQTNSLQFFPAIAIDPKGRLHVMWGDTRNDPTQSRYHIYYTTSDDGGQTWGFESREQGIRSPDARVTDFGSNPNRAFPRGRFIGDYFSIAASDSDVYLVWADSRLGEFGGINQKIAFARRKAIPSPEIFINPPAGPGGQEVTVQGFNLQPELNVFIQIGDVVVGTQRTNTEGRFTARLFMPVSGQGAQSVRILDESGNVAAGSFFTEFGFGDIRKGQQELAQQLGGANLDGKVARVKPGGNDDNGTAWWVIFLATLGGATVAALVASWITVRVVSRRGGSGTGAAGG